MKLNQKISETVSETYITKTNVSVHTVRRIIDDTTLIIDH